METQTITDLSGIPPWAAKIFKLSGKCIERYSNGNKCLEINYLNGKYNGDVIAWNKSGYKEWEYNLVNGELQ